MRCVTLLALALAFAALPAEVQAQRNQKKDEDFVKTSPAVGDSLPELAIYTSDGEQFQTANLRGQYAVLVFGCLT